VRWHFIEHLPKSIESPSRGSHAFQLQRCVVQSVSNKYVEHSLKLNGTSEQIHMLAHTHTHVGLITLPGPLQWSVRALS